MPILNLGYSDALNRDLEIEYKWDTHLFSDGERVPMFMCRPTHKSVWSCHAVYLCSKESVMDMAMQTLIRNYRIKQPRTFKEIINGDILL